MKLYSNPISTLDEGYTYCPKGNTVFCVCFSDDHWIPINVLVFSDTNKNAIAEVVKAIEWLKEKATSEEFDKQGYPSHRTKAHYEKILRLSRLCTVIEPNQLFKIGWADNDTI